MLIKKGLLLSYIGLTLKSKLKALLLLTALKGLLLIFNYIKYNNKKKD